MDITLMKNELVVVVPWRGGVYWGYLTNYDLVEEWVEIERMIGTSCIEECRIVWSKTPRRISGVYSVRVANEFDEICMLRVIELSNEQRRENAKRKCTKRG